MFRSNWTILRELMLNLAKATILWNWSVKIYVFNKRGHLLVKRILMFRLYVYNSEMIESVVLYDSVTGSKRSISFNSAWRPSISVTFNKLNIRFTPICALRTTPRPSSVGLTKVDRWKFEILYCYTSEERADLLGYSQITIKLSLCSPTMPW